MALLPFPVSGPARRLRRMRRLAAAVTVCVMALGSIQARASEVATWGALPSPDTPVVERSHGPNILGTVALPIRAKPTSTRWSKLMFASINHPALARLTERAQGLAPEAQAAFIQTAVNQSIRTGRISYDCSDDGYWAPASETLARGMGDCIDVAIAKMEALRFLGFSSSDLYLTTGRVRMGFGAESDRETAALLVRIGERFWLMSEQSWQIIEAVPSEDEVVPFTPVVTYGIEGTWVHGRLMKFAAAGN